MKAGIRRWVNAVMACLTAFAAILVVLPLILILAFLVYQGASALNLDFFTHLPKPVGEPGGGMANAVVGTLILIGLASCLNALLLWRGLHRNGSYVAATGWATFIVKLLVALSAMGVALWFAAGNTDAWLSMAAREKVLRLAAVVATGIVVYFGCLGALGFRFADFRRRAATWRRN